MECVDFIPEKLLKYMEGQKVEFTFETIGSNTFLVYEIPQSEEIDTMTLGMLTNNKISGMVPVLFTQLNASRYLKYNVSAKISVKQFFSGSVNKKRLLGVFSGIVSAVLAAEDYMIDVSNILLDTDYIFADVSTCHAEVICLPILNENAEGKDLKSFFKDIMFSTQFDQTENCDYVAKIINYLNGTVSFVPDEFIKILEELKEGKTAVHQVPVQQAPVQQGFVMQTPVQQSVEQTSVQQQNSVPMSNVQPQTSAPIAPSKPATGSKGFEVPGGGKMVTPQKQAPAQQPVQQSVQQNQGANGTQEKNMSVFYLLQHYNKENKEIYKAQKDQKKSAGKSAQPVAPTKQSAPKATSNAGFAIPGQGNVQPIIQQPQVNKPPVQQPQKTTPVQPMSSPVAPTSVQSAPIATPMPPQSTPAMNQFVSNVNFGETTVLGAGGGIGETTVLSSAPQQVTFRPYLVRMKNNEKIYLDKPMFKMGKEKSYVDYFIGDNPAISRSHADFIVRDEKVYVIDRNSTNHTYVNGQMIQSNVEVALDQDAKVKLANEEFKICMF